MLAPSPTKKYPRLSVILNLDRELPDPWLLDQSKPSRPFPLLSSATSWSCSFGYLLLRLGPAQSIKVCQPSYRAYRPPPQTGLQSWSSAAKNISWWASTLHFPLKTNPYSCLHKVHRSVLILVGCSKHPKRKWGAYTFVSLSPVLFLYRPLFSLQSQFGEGCRSLFGNSVPVPRHLIFGRMTSSSFRHWPLTWLSRPVWEEVQRVLVGSKVREGSELCTTDWKRSLSP